MSDFLGRLAERSMGVAPLVQPVVPAITAPASKDTAFGEPESFPEVSEAPAKAGIESGPRTARVVDAKRPAPIDERQEQVAPAPRRTIPALALERESGVREASVAAAETAFDSTVRNPARAQQEEEAAAAPERAWNSAVSDPLSARPFRGAPNEGPVIRVTIGRVEVRAEIGQTKTRHAPARPKPAGLSLDEYLKQRGEGRR